MNRVAARFSLAGIVALGALAVFVLVLQASPTGPQQNGPDLTAEISLDPPVPGVDEEFTVRVTVRNRGNASAGSFVVYIYADPPDQPPTSITPGAYPWGLPGLTAGGSSSLERTYTFTTTGCDHKIYVWVDREDNVAEVDETNNLVWQTVCVGVQCAVDAYEENDTCAAAGWIATGASQQHTFCPVGDEDWIKFSALGGITYTIEAANLGVHADPVLSLYNSCAGLSEFGTGPSIEWFAPTGGIYYIQARDRQETYGPLATYNLVITASTASGDIYEPDGDCTLARDITTDGTRQSHLFQEMGDQDWVRFAVNSGETFSIVADNVSVGVNPLVSLHSSCGQTLGQPLQQLGQIQAAAITGQTYYASVANQNPNVYGPDVHYDLSVTAIPCVADGFEADDGAAAAREMLTTGAVETHNTCPAGDEDWVRFTAEAGTIYVLQTSNLGFAADTVLHLYETDGATELAHNDDYGYVASSRIIWQAPDDGTYYAKVRHHNPVASGPDTRYDLSISKGRCTSDALEPDNGPLDAQPLATDGQLQDHNFCPEPALSETDAGDQDWVRFQAVGGKTYLIRTSNLGPNSDTVLELYSRNGLTRLASNDDHGPGRTSLITYTVPTSGEYYVRVMQYNANEVGTEASFQLSVVGEIPPTPTPTPTQTPTPTPTPRPTLPPSQVKTLILVNRQRFAGLYNPVSANALMDKLYELADHARVQGLVIQVENDLATSAAYSAWTLDQNALLNTNKANMVASALRNLVLTSLSAHPNVEYIVMVGDDPIIPYRRIPEGDLRKHESAYQESVTISTTQWAALRDDMILTDDFYADDLPTASESGELYIPDYAIGRLIEHPDEIIAFIDTFLAGDVIVTTRALVTGYDFVQDGGTSISAILQNDTIATYDTLIGFSWSGDALRATQLITTTRFEIQSINGHSTHEAAGAPDLADIFASEVVTATADFARTLVFSVGCHSGFNDTGDLDLAQAFIQRKANYVGNTGYGWGGGGVVYSEALMRNFTRELVRGTSTTIGRSLMAAKQRYYERALLFGPYDAKILMEATLYGLPMYTITSGGTLGDDDPFPSTAVTSTVPTAFGQVNMGRLEYGLVGSFGAFDENSGDDGTFLALDDSIHFSAGEPVQPRFFADISAPQAGSLHGAVFLGGVYTDVVAFDPVVALPFNEYVTSTAEPTFSATGWYPAVPFQTSASDTISTTTGTLMALLGQFNSDSGTERLYARMSFDTYYSGSPDTEPAVIDYVDGVLDMVRGLARIKVEASDPSNISRVVVAYTDGQAEWFSRDLTLDDAMLKWTATISATVDTTYFVQVVDGAGNVAIDDNKSQYHALSPSLPLVEGSFPGASYLPIIRKGD